MSRYIWHIGGPVPCKVCQDRDGKVFEGEFEPAHPNCTCWPEHLPDDPLAEAGVGLTEVAPGIFAMVGGGEEKPLDLLEKSRDVPLWSGKSKGVKVAFVAASPGQYDASRRVPMAGTEGLGFKRAVLEPLNLVKSQVGLTYLVPRISRVKGRIRPPSKEEIARGRQGLINDLRAINPQIIVALGSQAADALGDLADAVLPHPAALTKVKTETLSRKLKQIKSSMQKAEKGFYAQKYFVWPERRALIKASLNDEDKQLVYAIVLEPDTPDGEGDVFSAEIIEQLAHKYTAAINKEFQNWHSGQVFNAELVESEIAKTNYTWQGQLIKKGSWVVCLHILESWMWKLVKAGIYQGISVGGGYIHVERTT